MERRRADRERPVLHGREVPLALIEHEAHAAEQLRVWIDALRPQDPEGTTEGGW